MYESSKRLPLTLNAPAYSELRQARQRLSRNAQWRGFIITLIITDVLLILAAHALAFEIRFGLSLPFFQLDVVPVESFYRSLSFVLAPLWLFIFYISGLYKRSVLLGGTEEYARVLRAVTAAMLVVVIAGFLEPDFILARGWLLLTFLVSLVLVGFGRFTLRRVVYRLRERGYFLAPALIVGINDESKSLATQLVGWRTSGLSVLGLVGDHDEGDSQPIDGLPILGDLDSLDDAIREYAVEELILATSALSRRELLAVFQRYGFRDDINLRLSSGLFEIMTTGIELKEIAFVPLVQVNKVRLTGADRAMKLILDYGLTIPGLIFISPLLLAIALLVKLDSPGPIIYRRRVMGVNGKKFEAYKFRTMRVDGDEILAAHPELEEELKQNHKLRNDPRVTRMGEFLRKSSLDELPQLFNVLKREMSLVGPRMISPEEMAKYGDWGLNLLTVAPGITGLWQVSGRSDVSYEERVQLDMHYVRHWTIWFDLHILLRTIPAVVKGRGAY